MAEPRADDRQDDLPILYSFRRCPYAMRARLSLTVSGQACRLREILLRDKPAEMIEISPKATVPVLLLPDGTVLEESLDIMRWALGRNDPDQWLIPEDGDTAAMWALIAESDGDFKHHLDRYKYASRHGADTDPDHHREQGLAFLQKLEARLAQESRGQGPAGQGTAGQGPTEQAQLFGDRPCLADFAIFPFVRQFANTDRAWFDAAPLPRLQVWLEGHITAPLFDGVMQKFPVWAAGDPEPVFPSPIAAGA